MSSSPSDGPMFRLSRHARERQEQREITDDDISGAMEKGLKLSSKDATSYVDEKIQVVFSGDNQSIITVNQNKRNTVFDITERTKQKQEMLLHKAYVRHNNSAMCELAELYLQGELEEKDIKKAYNLFERAAKNGNSHAMCKIAEMYAGGDLGPPNKELEMVWLKRAAERKNVYALGVVGQDLLALYLKKYPLDSNVFRPSAPKKEILSYLQAAVDKGSTRALWQIANIYEHGVLGEKDLAKAVELYVEAAKKGSPASLDSLHKMAKMSTFSAQELEIILDYLSSFLYKTSSAMAYQLGVDQIHGLLGLNPVRGLKMVEQVALAKKYDFAIIELARCYRDGVACDSNLKLAQYWYFELYKLYNECATNGNMKSMWALGKLFIGGRIGKINLEKGESCFKEAVEKSVDPDLTCSLGRMYVEGKLGNKPLTIGYKLIAEAIKKWKSQFEQGVPTACRNISSAYYFLKKYSEAVSWLNKASDDDLEAKLLLVKIHLDKFSSVGNTSLALTLLDDAILKGVEPGKALDKVSMTVNSETERWFHTIADKVIKDTSPNGSSEYKLQELVVHSLAVYYKNGILTEINYALASKYYFLLFNNFESTKVTAGIQLAVFSLDSHLPNEYVDSVKQWLEEQIPTLFETAHFGKFVFLLGELYQIGTLLPINIMEATKWLNLALYFVSLSSETRAQIEQHLAKLPSLDSSQKEQMISQLEQSTENIKATSPSNYKVMSRILGDIFYDSKISNKDVDKAIYWYTESHLKNNGRATLALANIFKNDKADINAAIKWYKSATQLGNTKALEILKSIASDSNEEDLMNFLDGYDHRSVIEESELMDINPLWGLELYPEGTQETYEQGKYYQNLIQEDSSNAVNAAFWFRKSMMLGNIKAAVELFSLYKSGLLGNHVVPVADSLSFQALILSYHKLKRVRLFLINSTKQLSDIFCKDTSDLLENIISVLNSESETSRELRTISSALSSKPDDITADTLQVVLSKLETLLTELYFSFDLNDNFSDEDP